MKIFTIEGKPGTFGFHCPGCGYAHVMNTTPGTKPCWEFNGDREKPTFKPSILSRWPEELNGTEIKMVCHCFVTDGLVKFEADSTHEHAGQTLEIPNIDKW